MNEQRLLQELNTASGWMTMETLTSRLSCSERTIRSMLLALRDQGCVIEQKRGQGYRLQSSCKTVTPDMAGRLYRQLYEKMWLLYAREPASLSRLAQKFYISRSQAKKDMDLVLPQLEAAGITWSRSARGLVLEAADDMRRNAILREIESQYLSAGECHTLFDFLEEGSSRWLAVFKTCTGHLIERGIRAEDETLIWFVNWLLMARRFPLSWPFSPAGGQEGFGGLTRRLQPLLDLPEGQWPMVEAVCESLFLRQHPAQVQELAASVCSRFFQICRTQFRLEFNAGQRDLLISFLAGQILLPGRQGWRDSRLLERIRREYAGSYGIALEMKYVLDAYGLPHEEADFIMLALMIRTIQMKARRGPKTAVFLIGSHDSLFNHHLLQALQDTQDPRFLELQTMSLFEFNRQASQLDPDNTLILSVDAGPFRSAKEHGLECLRIEPLLTASEAARIQAKVMELHCRQEQKKTRKAIEDVLPCLRVESDPARLESGVRCRMQAGPWIILQGLENRNELVLCANRLRFCFDPDTRTGHSILRVRDLIVSQTEPGELEGGPAEQILMRAAQQET